MVPGKNNFIILILVIFLLAAAGAPAAANGVDVTRTVPLSVAAGSEFEVTLSITDLDAGGIVETIPAGFTYVSTTHPADGTSVSGQHVIFSVIGETEIAYRVIAPSGGSGTFTGVWDDLTTLTNGMIPATRVDVSSDSGGDSDDGNSAVATTTTTPGANGTVMVLKNRTFTIGGEEVTTIAIAANASVEGANISVEVLEGSGSTSAAPGTVYRYLTLNLTGLADDDLTGATVGFQVSRSWIAAHNISKGSVALARYHDGWSLLPTTAVGSDARYLSFEAETPGFSVFAITGEEMAVDQTVKTTGTPVTIAAPKGAAAVVKEKDAESSVDGEMLPIFGAVGALLVIAGIGAYYVISRKKDGGKE